MSIVITLLTVFLVMVSLLLILVTLMQRPKQEGLGAAFGGGMMDSTFGAQTTDVLQKSTVWLTVAFFGAAVLLTVLNTRHYKSQRDVGNILEEVQKAEPIPSFPTPAVDAAPATTPTSDAKKSEPAKADSKKEAKKSTPAAKKDTKKPAAKASEPAKPTAATPAKADTSKPEAGEKDKK